jgi:hypothetical protein
MSHITLNSNNHRLKVDYQPLVQKVKDITESFGIDDGNRGSNSRGKKYRVRIVEPPNDNHSPKPSVLENTDSLFGKQRKILKFSNKNLNAKELIKNHKQFKAGFQGSKFKNHSHSPYKLRPATRLESKEGEKLNDGKEFFMKISKNSVEKERPSTNVLSKKKLIS